MMMTTKKQSAHAKKYATAFRKSIANPALSPAEKAELLQAIAQYGTALDVLAGESTAMSMSAAQQVVKKTTAEVRRHYVGTLKETGGQLLKKLARVTGTDPWDPPEANPAVSAAQYGMAQAVLSGASTAMPVAVARELVEKTSPAMRKNFAKELHGNPEQQRYLDTSTFHGYPESEYERARKSGTLIFSGPAQKLLRGTPVAVLQKGKHSSLVRADYYGTPFYGWVDNANIVAAAKFRKLYDYEPGLKGNRHSNPEDDAAAMYESFHGTPATGELVIEDQVHYHGNLAELGVLCGLKVRVGATGEDYTVGFGGEAGQKQNPLGYMTFTAEQRQAAKEYLTQHWHELGETHPDFKRLPLDDYIRLNLFKTLRNMVLGYGHWKKNPPKGKRKSKPGPLSAAYAAATGLIPGVVEIGDSVIRGVAGNRRGNPGDAGPVILCSNESGNQLYFRGGDQSLDLDSIKLTDFARDHMVIGEVWAIAYSTKKSFDDFSEIEYVHVLGEEKFHQKLPKSADLWEDAEPPREEAFDVGNLPTLMYDTLSQALSLAGGIYKIEKPWMETSPGIEN
jgi:hypothetical protein